MIEKADQIIPYFVMDTLGSIPGLSGLFVAGIFSASLRLNGLQFSALSFGYKNVNLSMQYVIYRFKRNGTYCIGRFCSPFFSKFKRCYSDQDFQRDFFWIRSYKLPHGFSGVERQFNFRGMH